MLPRSTKLVTFTKATRQVNQLRSSGMSCTRYKGFRDLQIGSLITPNAARIRRLQRSCFGYPSLHSYESLCRAGSGQIAVLLVFVAVQNLHSRAPTKAPNRCWLTRLGKLVTDL